MTNGNGRHTADSHPGTAVPTGADDDSISPEVTALEADIERTREELAQTVDQLTAKLDVKARVQNRAAEARDRLGARARYLQHRATDENGRPTPVVVTAAGGLVAGLAAMVLVAMWRRSSGSGRKRRSRR